jgi:hypothetical protein
MGVKLDDLTGGRISDQWRYIALCSFHVVFPSPSPALAKRMYLMAL